MYITFPEMEDEVFINLLGYKEPNLAFLWRCKVSTRVAIISSVLEYNCLFYVYICEYTDQVRSKLDISKS